MRIIACIFAFVGVVCAVVTGNSNSGASSSSTVLLTDSKVPELVVNQQKFLEKAMPTTAEKDKTSSYLFVNREHFFDELHKAMRNWRHKRGYHLEDSFEGVRDLSQYSGHHPYGYLSEAELAELANAGDSDAKMIHAYYYLKNSNPDAAYATFEDVVINTNQTAPLGSMGVFLITGHSKKNEYPDILSRENDAAALFMLMKNRKDPLGEEYLKLVKFDQFDAQRQEAILQKANAMGDDFIAKRQQAGLGPFDDDVFDGSKELNLPKNIYDQLYAEYSKRESAPMIE